MAGWSQPYVILEAVTETAIEIRSGSLYSIPMDIDPNNLSHGITPAPRPDGQASPQYRDLSSGRSAGLTRFPAPFLHLPSMSSALARYESFLIQNVSTISSLESTLRSVTWLLPGRFKDAELVSEAC